MEDNKKNIKGIPVKYYIILTMIVFCTVLVFSVWFYQSFFSERVYRTNKIRGVVKTAELLSEMVEKITLDLDHRGDFYKRLENETFEHDACGLVINLNAQDYQLMVAPRAQRACPIANLSTFSLQVLHDVATHNENSIVLYAPGDSKLDINNLHTTMTDDEFRSVVYVKNTKDASNNDICIIISTILRPVGVERTTLAYQLWIIALIVIVLSIILSYYLGKIIVNPIHKVNNQAIKLAKGNYDAAFDDEKGYAEINQLASTLNYAAEELSKVDRLKNELIANVSHDLRTPLTMISGYGEVIRDIPSENTKENIQIIIDEANHLNEMVTNLMDLSKLESGSVPMDFKVNDLTLLLEEICQRYQKLIENEGFNVTFKYDQHYDAKFDSVRITQVVYNLLNNAINYSDGNKNIEVIQHKTSNDMVKIEVIDHGIGVKKEDLPHVWDRYYRVDKEHKRAIKGTGLGLSIVKSILQIHGARYGVNSEFGKGSTFWFALPIENKGENL